MRVVYKKKQSVQIQPNSGLVSCTSPTRKINHVLHSIIQHVARNAGVEETHGEIDPGWEDLKLIAQ